MEEEIKQLKERLDKIEQQKIPYTLDDASISSLNEKSRRYIKELSIAEGNGILIDSKALKDGDNIILGLNGDITKKYRLVIECYIDDEAPSGNYIAFNNNIVSDGLSFIEHYTLWTSGSSTHDVTGATDTDRMALLYNCTLIKGRYNAVVDIDARLSTESNDRRMITVKENCGNSGGAYQSEACFSVSYSRANLTSLNIYLSNSTSNGVYKLYKVIR